MAERQIFLGLIELDNPETVLARHEYLVSGLTNGEFVDVASLAYQEVTDYDA